MINLAENVSSEEHVRQAEWIAVVIDDDPASFLKKCLESAKIAFVGGGVESCQSLLNLPDGVVAKIQLIVIDHSAGETTEGGQLVERINHWRQLNPRLCVIEFSGIPNRSLIPGSLPLSQFPDYFNQFFKILFSVKDPAMRLRKLRFFADPTRFLAAVCDIHGELNSGNIHLGLSPEKTNSDPKELFAKLCAHQKFHLLLGLLRIRSHDLVAIFEAAVKNEQLDILHLAWNTISLLVGDPELAKESTDLDRLRKLIERLDQSNYRTLSRVTKLQLG